MATPPCSCVSAPLKLMLKSVLSQKLDPSARGPLRLARQPPLSCGVEQGVENKRLAKSVYKTRPSVKKYLLHSLGCPKVSYSIPEVETLISRPRRLPCTTQSCAAWYSAVRDGANVIVETAHAIETPRTSSTGTPVQRLGVQGAFAVSYYCSLPVPRAHVLSERGHPHEPVAEGWCCIDASNVGRINVCRLVSPFYGALCHQKKKNSVLGTCRTPALSMMAVSANA